MPDAITLLTEDHRHVERLFEEFDRTQDPQVALEVCLQLSVHAMAAWMTRCQIGPASMTRAAE